MSFDAKRLYDLLPAVYRIRDAQLAAVLDDAVRKDPLERERKTAGPLKALLWVIADQVAIIEEDLAQLYDDQFIETCAEWVVPYIADLVGHPIQYGTAPKAVSPRAVVANTIAYRRRKGTSAILEHIAHATTGWHARVVEFFQVVGWTQNMNHICAQRSYGPDVRKLETVRKINGPFDPMPHTVDVRDICKGGGRHNIKNLAIFLWRLTAWPITSSSAVKVDNHRFLFSPLGHNTQLFVHPKSVDDLGSHVDEINVPSPITRELLRIHLKDYLGEDKSLNVEVGGQKITQVYGKQLEDIVEVCDLSDTAWAHLPRPGRLAIDPVLGRIAFGDEQTTPPEVSFHYGFSAAIGGGEYNRQDSIDWALQRVKKVENGIQEGLDAISSAMDDGGAVEITNSRRYEERLTIHAPAGRRLELRASNQTRPVIVLPNRHPFEITGDADAVVTLNGLVVAGGTIHVRHSQSKGLRLLRLRHCTLVPGLALERNGLAKHPGEPSLILELSNISVEIDHCILGVLHVKEVANLRITDSILDAGSSESPALTTPGNGRARTALAIRRSTVFGQVRVHSLELAENCIFTGEVCVANRQSGCVRFCYLPPAPNTPRRYECQPGGIAAESREAERVRPQFDSERFGEPAYGRLSRCCAKEIRQGADDEAEMGAFHDLYQPQREAALNSRIASYMPFGLQAGAIYVT